LFLPREAHQFAHRTGQLWKLNAAFVAPQILVVPAALYWLLGGPWPWLVWGVIGIVFLALFLWSALTIRCPRCGGAPYSYGITVPRREPVREDAGPMVRCPDCGFEPPAPSSSPA
jgi:hypothetical protein